LLSTLDWVHDLNLGSIDFEFDAKEGVDSILSLTHDTTKFGIIIHNCKIIFKQYYVNYNIEFVRRQVNEEIYNLREKLTCALNTQVIESNIIILCRNVCIELNFLICKK